MPETQRIPVHAREVQNFTPIALGELQDPPSFKLKAPTREQREEMQYALHEAGLRRHTDEDLREVTIEELCRLWDCDETDENVERLRRYWQAADDYNDEAAEHLAEMLAAQEAGEEAPAPLAAFEHPDDDKVEELTARLVRSSPRLRRMGTENVRFAKQFPRYAIAHCLTGWTGLDAQARFEEGVLKVDSVCDVQDEMEAKFGEKGEAAYVELAGAAVNRFFLTRDAEKNSASGPASKQTPGHTKGTGSASKAGTSQESAPSAEIQDA